MLIPKALWGSLKRASTLVGVLAALSWWFGFSDEIEKYNKKNPLVAGSALAIYFLFDFTVYGFPLENKKEEYKISLRENGKDGGES